VTAAYVAKLDSICAAAQAKVKNEIKVIPQQNQPAIIAARERVIRETMPELRGARCRRRFTGPRGQPQ
jgi:hypothetical protein